MEIAEGYDDDVIDLRGGKGNKKPRNLDGVPVPEIGETPDDAEEFPDGTDVETGITPAIPQQKPDSGILPTMIIPGTIDKIIPPGLGGK